MSIKILIVDDDEWTRKIVDTLFLTRGYRVLQASNGEEGLEIALTSTPDIIISDVVMPRMNGWTFLKHLRSMSQFDLLPFFFLTSLDSAKARMQGFHLGADDYLTKPVIPEELDLRVERALQRIVDMRFSIQPQVEPVQQMSREGSGLQGMLNQVNLPAILTLLEMEQKRGILAVTPVDGGEGVRLFIKDGFVVSARLESGDEPKNEQLIYSILGWQEGRFQFKTLPIDAEAEIRMSTSALLLEGARIRDEEQRSKT